MASKTILFFILFFPILLSNCGLFLLKDEISADVITPSNGSFISVWNPANVIAGGTNSNQVKLPLEQDGIYDFIVEWGDGSSDRIMSYDDPHITHTYTEKLEEYEITISGRIKGFRFDMNNERLKLSEIRQWGKLNLGNSGSYFCGCENLRITATDMLDLSGTTNMNHAFAFCRYLTTAPSMNDWDVSKVTDMSQMFASSLCFNQDIGNWNTSSVKNMYGMFCGAELFNKDIGNWNVSNVTDMRAMFSGAINFNRPLNKWNVGNVENMYCMFIGTGLFNQDIANWDVSKVNDMGFMFCDTDSFNRDISGWKVSNVVNMAGMFHNAVSFKGDISGWDVSSVNKWQEIFVGCGIPVENTPVKFRTIP